MAPMHAPASKEMDEAGGASDCSKQDVVLRAVHERGEGKNRETCCGVWGVQCAVQGEVLCSRQRISC